MRAVCCGTVVRFHGREIRRKQPPEDKVQRILEETVCAEEIRVNAAVVLSEQEGDGHIRRSRATKKN